eukprot:1747159-Pyramimonas_sp.AAC.1
MLWTTHVGNISGLSQWGASRDSPEHTLRGRAHGALLLGNPDFAVVVNRRVLQLVVGLKLGFQLHTVVVES